MSRPPRPDSLRLHPPPQALPAPARWVLERAFALPDGPPVEAPTDCAAAIDWAVRLGLGERLTARRGVERLTREIGAAATTSLVAAGHHAAAHNLLLRELAAVAVAAAAARRIPLFLLKGMALLEELGGLEATRPLADVDVLVEPAAARELALALEGESFSRSTVHESAHHLPALHHPQLGTLEIHLHLPGVGLPGETPLGAATLLANENSRPAPELAPARLPARPILTAHAIAHCLVQNANSPRSYPLLRLVGDLQDLANGSSVADLVALGAPWLATSVSPRELAALGRLGDRLGAGRLPRPGADARRFVDHVVAAHLDPGYRRAVRTRALEAAVRRGDWFKIRRRAAISVSRRGAAVGRFFGVGWKWLTQRQRRGGAADGL